MEIAVNMMRELSLNYVDPVDPDKLMEGAAAGMVRDLDPYTEYHPRGGDVRTSSCSPRASTAASGSLIRQKGDWVTHRAALPGFARRPGRAEDRRQNPRHRRQGRQGLHDRAGLLASQGRAGQQGQGDRRAPRRHAARRRRPCSASGSRFRACPTRDGSPTASATSATATSPKGATKTMRAAVETAAHRGSR